MQKIRLVIDEYVRLILLKMAKNGLQGKHSDQKWQTCKDYFQK